MASVFGFFETPEESREHLLALAARRPGAVAVAQPQPGPAVPPVTLAVSPDSVDGLFQSDEGFSGVPLTPAACRPVVEVRRLGNEVSGFQFGVPRGSPVLRYGAAKLRSGFLDMANVWYDVGSTRYEVAEGRGDPALLKVFDDWATGCMRFLRTRATGSVRIGAYTYRATPAAVELVESGRVTARN
jgi:hypothetical protein